MTACKILWHKLKETLAEVYQQLEKKTSCISANMLAIQQFLHYQSTLYKKCCNMLTDADKVMPCPADMVSTWRSNVCWSYDTIHYTGLCQPAWTIWPTPRIFGRIILCWCVTGMGHDGENWNHYSWHTNRWILVTWLRCDGTKLLFWLSKISLNYIQIKCQKTIYNKT